MAQIFFQLDLLPDKQIDRQILAFIIYVDVNLQYRLLEIQEFKIITAHIILECA